MAKVRIPARTSKVSKKNSATTGSKGATAAKKRKPNVKLLEFVKRTSARRAEMPAIDIGDSVRLIRELRSGGSHEPSGA